MTAMGHYDSSLQMFVQAPRELDRSRLAFMRWLAENDRLEHSVAGESTGECLLIPPQEETWRTQR